MRLHNTNTTFDVQRVVTPNHARLVQALGVTEIDFLGRPEERPTAVFTELG